MATGAIQPDSVRTLDKINGRRTVDDLAHTALSAAHDAREARSALADELAEYAHLPIRCELPYRQGPVFYRQRLLRNSVWGDWQELAVILVGMSFEGIVTDWEIDDDGLGWFVIVPTSERGRNHLGVPRQLSVAVGKGATITVLEAQE
jgi:hypothetical protein